ncbi:hypothetical protein O6H91_07G055200 [Diphasiastrum complanatum]|uniref:Uncharacterized protein n=1 Tax=Diphasiastrum complanatum TaxID=34168 RepID=A0ACC2D5H7_DIPCM|nr:hypothetical protein O6H91_07G055200 [Diphasiastrum complanatum]
MASLPTVPRIKLGSQGLEVSAQGLGCMGMSAFYGPPKPEADMIDLIHYAVDKGVTFLDTSDVYGPHTNEILVGKAIKGIRDKVQLATKFAVAFDDKGNRSIRGDPLLIDVDYIDLYYQHRVDPKVPIEVTVGEVKKLVEEGKVKYLGLSEASASDIRRAHSVHPITAVQLEWSLWARDVEEDVIPTCRELGIGIVAYSPLGRGFFSGKQIEEFAKGDVRKVLDLLLAFNYEAIVCLRGKKESYSGTACLAWVHHQGLDVAPIPGTTKIKIKLSEEVKELEDAVPIDKVAGDRYGDMSNTWRYASTPPLSAWQKA